MELTWERLADLEREHGDSFFLADLDRFQENYCQFQDAFRARYGDSHIAYSYKTNYTPHFCRLVDTLGGYAEVVSRMEYDLALRIGVDPARIIFNGPFKRPLDLELALIRGSIVNLDSAYEVEAVKAIAARHPAQRLRVGIRCNFDVGTTTVSRFGFDTRSPDFGQLFDDLRELDNCVIEGLHCHYLAPQRSAEAYGAIAARMIELADANFDGGAPAFIDIGGGFYSRMSPELQRQFGHTVPTFAEYAEAITAAFVRRYAPGSGPKLLLEPGIAVVADVVKFAARVVDVKRVGARRVALVAGSIYDIKPTLNAKNLPMRVVQRQPQRLTQESSEPIDVVGYSCMEGDCLFSGYRGELAPGDYVVFDNVGAYTNVLRPPFINPAPPMLAWQAQTGEFVPVKRRETVDDVFATYAM